MATRKKLILAHSGKKDIYKRMWAARTAGGQSEEMDATASRANALETTAGDTATPAQKRILHCSASGSRSHTFFFIKILFIYF